MSGAPESPWEGYRSVLRLLARRLVRSVPHMQRRFDESDLVQQAMLQAEQARQEPGGTIPDEPLAWLQSILKHVFLDVLRREGALQRDVALERSLEEALDDSSAQLRAFSAAQQPSPAEQAMRHEFALDVAAALERLPDDEREVVIAHDIEGESLRDIEARLGIPRSTAARRLADGRRRRRQLLPGHGREVDHDA